MLGKGNYACSVSLDFGKAFDTVDHNIAIETPELWYKGNCQILVWILFNKPQASYKIRQHYFRTKVHNMWSATRKYIRSNTIPTMYQWHKNSSKILKYFLFADDTSTLLINEKVEPIEKTYNEKLRHVSECLNAIKFSLNVGKSNLILFRKCQTKRTYETDIKIMGEHIKEKEYAKYLGMLIDKKHSWTYHINPVNLKISRGKAILTKLRHYVSKDNLRTLYFAFV